jgi:hypothetical protein
MNVAQRRRIIRWATILLTIGAFANSYRHGVQWALEHSPEGQAQFWAWAIAALPEVMVLIGVMLALNRLSDPRAWVIGGTGVAWTLWANGASSAGGLSGMFVALSPAWAALMALWAMDHAQDEPAQVEPVSLPGEPIDPAQQGDGEPEPEPLKTAQNDPPKPPREPRKRRTVSRSQRLTSGSGGTSRAVGIDWAAAQAEPGLDRLNRWPTVPEIMAQFPEMSYGTAKRVREAQPRGTRGTADQAQDELSVSRAG